MVLRTTPMGENGRDNATSRSFRAAAEEVGSGADHHEQHKRTPGHLFSTDHRSGLGTAPSSVGLSLGGMARRLQSGAIQRSGPEVFRAPSARTDWCASN